MPQLEAQVLEHLRTLPIVQQQEVLNFILALSQRPAPTNAPEIFPQSFTAAAHQYVGGLEGGPSDLSTNPEHMAGFGA
jgi:hypothetical protein